MAAVVGKFFRPVLGSNKFLNLRYVNKHFPKCSSVYAPDFKEPIIDREEIKKLVKSQPTEEILESRIKPALKSVPCSIFYDPFVEKLTNQIMRKGKRELAKSIVRDSFTKIKHIQLRKYNNEVDEEKKKDILLNPREMFLLAVKNVSPLLWYVRLKKSGSWYKVPTGITEEKARRIAIKWIVECAKIKGTKTKLSDQLADEILAASQYEGKAVNKKIELHKMCEANRGYAHYWWG